MIQWAALPEDEATWEPLDEFRAKFPAFQLKDELFIEGGVMLWWERCTTTVTRRVAKVGGRGQALGCGHQALASEMVWASAGSIGISY